MRILSISRTEALSLSEQVYQRLRNGIITGKIRDGTRLVESALAEDMGVSRTPVREALQRCAQEGLVYSIPRAGFIVEEMSEADVHDLFKTRTAIEQIVGRWALAKITGEEILRLEANLEKTDQVLESGRTEEMITLDIEFHNIIYRASRSKRLYQICKTLSDHTLKFRIACIHVPEVARRARENHAAIAEAIKGRDPEAVEAAMAGHLRVVQKDIVDFLKKVREESFFDERFGA